MPTETTVSLWRDRAPHIATYDDWTARRECYDIVVVARDHGHRDGAAPR